MIDFDDYDCEREEDIALCPACGAVIGVDPPSDGCDDPEGCNMELLGGPIEDDEDDEDDDDDDEVEELNFE
jgi:hypothetical protein